MKSKRLLSIVLAVMLVLGLAPAMSIPVKAAGNGKAIQMGGGAIAAGDTVYYGSAGKPWRVLSLSGSGGTYSDGTNSVAADSALFLFSEAALFQTVFHDFENNYTNSTLRAELNNRISDYFTAGEESALLNTTKDGGSISLAGFNYSDPGLGGDRLFALSANELQAYLGYSDDTASWTEGLSGLDWWLRSAYDDYFGGAGAVYSHGDPIDHFVGDDIVWARPAFNLNLNSVLFTSAAAGGKSSGAGGADALASVGTYAGSEWKVTLKGLTSDFNVSCCVGTYNSETRAITVKYTGAAGNYISAIVTDSTGQTIKKYGKIASVSGAAGEVTINTAGKMDAGDKLFVFCEQDNGDNMTDYASELKKITLPPAGHVWQEATCTEPKTCTICGAMEGSANGHSFTYALSEDQKTITATCSAENCPSGYHENGFVVTLNAPENLVYDGTAKEAVISGYPDSAVPQLADKPNVVYYKSTGSGSTEPDGDALAGAPKDAGNYVAQITWGEKTAGAAFTITKTAAQITAAPSASAITYGQTLKDSTLSGGQAGVPGTFAWKDDSKAPAVSDSDTTEYDVVFTPDDTDNYDTAECKVTVTVNKADASVTADPEAKNLAWNGKAQKLVSEGTAEGGEMQYALGADDKTVPEGGWSADVPEAADPNTYFIWYKAAGDENHNDSEAGYVKSTITAKLISYEVTFKVENGSWDDKSSGDKTVTLSRYEDEDLALVLKDTDIPAVGNEPAEHYKAGSWDVTPSTETAITKDTAYTYTYAEKEKISQTVTFKVVNGAWDDGKTEDVVVTLNGYEGDTLKLSAEQVPAVGNKPAEGYMAGSWDVTPSTETEIKDNPAYTYTYAKKPVYKVIEGADGKVQKGSGKGLTFKTDGDYAKFTGIKIDSKEVVSSMYDSKSGSTVVTLKPSLIDKLDAGRHTIEFLYTDGSCGTEFEVQAAATPTNTPTPAPTKTPSNGSGKTAANTGDNDPAGLWMLLLAGSLGSLILVFALRRKMIK